MEIVRLSQALPSRRSRDPAMGTKAIMLKARCRMLP